MIELYRTRSGLDIVTNLVRRMSISVKILCATFSDIHAFICFFDCQNMSKLWAVKNQEKH